jgi:hypothetical protein
MKIELSPTLGRALFVLCSLLLLWVATTDGVPETLGRYGISARSTESKGFLGSEPRGTRSQLRGESYGAGGSDLKTRRFLARRGQELVLDYDLSLKRGMVRVSLTRLPAFGTDVWAVTVQGERHGTIRVPIQRTGIHQLSVTQFRYTGTYDLAWKLE